MADGREVERYVSASQLEAHAPLSIDEHPYYMQNGLMTIRTHDWLKSYERDGMVHLPASEGFLPWKQKHTSGFVLDPKEVDGVFSYLYDERQLFAVKIALRGWGWRHCNIDPAQLFFSEHTRRRVREYYAFLAFFQDIEKMGRSWEEEKQELYQYFLKENNQNEREAEMDWKSHFKAEEAENLRMQAEKIAGHHRMTVEQMKEWQSFLVKQSVLAEEGARAKVFKDYRNMASLHALVNAEECNRMVYELQQFLLIWKNERGNLKEILLGVEGLGYISCIECGTLFEPLPNIRNPKFCSDRCKKMHDAARKREARRQGKI